MKKNNLMVFIIVAILFASCGRYGRLYKQEDMIKGKDNNNQAIETENNTIEQNTTQIEIYDYDGTLD